MATTRRNASRERASLRQRAVSVACALALVACALLAGGCAAQSTADNSSDGFAAVSDRIDSAQHSPSSAAVSSASDAATGDTSDDRAAQAAVIVEGMTLEEKVAQMFIVTPEAITGVGTATAAGTTTQQALEAYPVGGIVYFQKNLENPDQTRTMIENTQRYAQEAVGLPLFIGVDEEGGTVSRVGGNSGFGIANVGDMSAVGATGDATQAKETAKTIGGYLSDLGFNLDFAPDADICGDPATDVMARRSFGQDPELVATMVSAQVEGFLGEGVLCCAKHFPGIGGVAGDSHEGTISSTKTLDDLRSFELVPFEAAIEAGVPLIMVGHLSTPNATGDDTPASLNHAIVTELLRDELGFDGLIATDSLSMGAVGGFCTPSNVGVTVIEAGVDLILMPEDFTAAYQGVLDAVANGTISEERIDESVERIVETKLAYLS